MGSKGIIVVLSTALVVGVVIPTVYAVNYKVKYNSETKSLAAVQQKELVERQQFNNTENKLKSEETDLQSKLAMYESKDPGSNSSSSSLSNVDQYYVDHFLKIFDINAQMYDSIANGSVPGCTFKVTNEGSKTITALQVTVYYKNAEGQVIGQQDCPIVGSEVLDPNYYTLPPHYTYQQENDNFWSAPSVNASDWQVGSVSLKVTNIEFQ